MWEIPTAYLVFSAIMSAVGLGVSAYNIYQNKKAAQQNTNLQQEQFNYQKELNETVMAREDNAMQRQVEDLKAAGLSPLMISGGANATPLTSSNAPQMDMSGMNQSIQNAIGAYNDIFNRHLQEKQFRLQAKLQTEKILEEIETSKFNRDYINAQKDYLKRKLEWEQTHGFRDLDWRSELINFGEELLNKSDSSSKDKLDNIISEVKDTAAEAGIKSPTGDIMTYGLLPDKNTGYAHNFDFENYGNDRDSWTLLKEESKEKAAKIALRIKDTEDNREKLYNTDDYLQKHISLENWKKASLDFIKYYLKNGMFEGHKKYFD